jgi:acetolactate synthase small subunit
MQVFDVRYRNTQGTLMRILNAASRRGIEMPYVQAQPAEQESHRVTLLLDVNPKQAGQLYRDWYAVVDVMDVSAGAPTKESAEHGWVAGPHPPASATTAEASRSASA